jgi:hypothetical protein
MITRGWWDERENAGRGRPALTLDHEEGDGVGDTGDGAPVTPQCPRVPPHQRRKHLHPPNDNTDTPIDTGPSDRMDYEAINSMAKRPYESVPRSSYCPTR